MAETLREKAIEGYLQRNDGIDWRGLMTYANTMFDVRDSISVPQTTYSFNGTEARKLFDEHEPYLSVHPLSIDPEAFRENCKAIGLAFIDKGLITAPEHIDFVNSIDWSRLTDETIAIGGKDPSLFFEVANKDLGVSEDNADAQAVLAGLFINLLRAYLNPIGEEETEALRKLDEVSVRDKPLLCPTCGSRAAISSVREAEGTQSNERQLFCSCCGTVWPFERVRCAVCGSTNSDKLKYYYADEDPAHRIHVCETCGGNMPTVFQNAMKGAMNYDIELIVMGIVQNIYESQIKEQE